MKTRVQIPTSFASEARLGVDTCVELSLEDGTLVTVPWPPEPLTLDELLRGVTDEKLHGAWDTGPAVGKEVW